MFYLKTLSLQAIPKKQFQQVKSWLKKLAKKPAILEMI